MEFKVITARFTSRKFLVAMVGIITGIIAILKGETVTGCALIGSAMIAYLAAEGYIDAQSAKAMTLTTAELIDAVSQLTANEIDDIVAEIIFRMGEAIIVEGDEDGTN